MPGAFDMKVAKEERDDIGIFEERRRALEPWRSVCETCDSGSGSRTKDMHLS